MNAGNTQRESGCSNNKHKTEFRAQQNRGCDVVSPQRPEAPAVSHVVNTIISSPHSFSFTCSAQKKTINSSTNVSSPGQEKKPIRCWVLVGVMRTETRGCWGEHERESARAAHRLYTVKQEKKVVVVGMWGYCNCCQSMHSLQECSTGPSANETKTAQ